MINNWLTRKETGKLEGVIWNTLGAGISATQAAVILVFVSRYYDLYIAGIISIAYAIANVVMTASKYGIRYYQSTDIREETGFPDYFSVRIITVFLALIFSFLFLGFKFVDHSYGFEKILIVFEVILLKQVDSLEDVFLGRFQQLGRFTVGAKMMALRQLIVTASICAAIVCRLSIPTSLGLGIAVSLLLDIFLIRVAYPALDAPTLLQFSRGGAFRLLKVCFPLFVGNTLAIYASNIPKYAIDAYSSENIQALFGYLMLPVFVVTLCSQFIFLPFVKDFGDEWERRNIKALFRRIVIQCVLILLITLLVMGFCMLVGLRILSVIYNTDLGNYTNEFLLLLLGGSLYTLSYFLTIPLTAIRRQRVIEVGYVLSVAAAFMIQKKLITSYGMLGAGLLYLLVNLILFILFSVALFYYLRKESVSVKR